MWVGQTYFTTAFRKVFSSCSFFSDKRLKTEAETKALLYLIHIYPFDPALEEIEGGHVKRDFLAAIPFLASKALVIFCIPPNPPDSDVGTTRAICVSFSNQQME